MPRDPRLDLDGVPAALAERYGRPEPGGPALDPFEALVATLLGRALDPRKRDAALDALRGDGLLDPEALAGADPDEVDAAIRSAGLAAPRSAGRPLIKVARWLLERHGGSADGLADPDGPAPTSGLRDELAAINGVGPATADALLLFALKRPVYPVDRATYRAFVRHGWLDPDAGYDEAREAAVRLAPGDPGALARLSLDFERLGREYCRVSVAKCEKCPLRPFLPEGGAVDPSG